MMVERWKVKGSGGGGIRLGRRDYVIGRSVSSMIYDGIRTHSHTLHMQDNKVYNLHPMRNGIGEYPFLHELRKTLANEKVCSSIAGLRIDILNCSMIPPQMLTQCQIC